MSNQPLIVDIIQETHTHTATVYNWESLENYLRMVHTKSKWRWGSIHSYGGFSCEEIVSRFRSLECWSSYDRSI